MTKTDRRRKRRRQAYRDSLRAVLRNARPADWGDGAEWYRVARDGVRRVSRMTGLPTETVAGVVAALSPRNRWERNTADAAALLVAHLLGGDVPPITTTRANVRAALRIASGEDWRAVLKGPKVRAFADALAGDDDAAVVDVWMARAMTGGRREEPRSAADYEDMAAALRYVARRDCAWPVAWVQATAWLVARRDGNAPKEVRS